MALGEVETFIPVTPTVFIRVAHAAVRMQELHDHLNREGVCCTEELPYIPHLTIAKMGSEELAWKAFELARRRWAEYKGAATSRSRKCLLSEKRDQSVGRPRHHDR